MSGSTARLSVSVRAMDSAVAPVSIAIEVEIFVISALRNFSGSRRYGLVSMSGRLFTLEF